MSMIAALIRHRREILLFDAITCLGFGLGCLVLAGAIETHLAIPSGWSLSAGLICIGFGLFVLLVARRDSPPPMAMWLVILGNLGWALASFASLAGGWLEPNGLGVVFVIVQGVFVLALGEAQLLALRAGQRPAAA
jgi:hypothetical protein